MRYMLMVYAAEAEPGAEPPSPEAMQAAIAAHAAYYNEVAQQGILQAAERLRPSFTATTVRVHDGQVLVTDGPFAETKERLGGINIFECQDLDEAIALAARFPTVAAGLGCIEIRPIWEPGAEMLKQFSQAAGGTGQ